MTQGSSTKGPPADGAFMSFFQRVVVGRSRLAPGDANAASVVLDAATLSRVLLSIAPFTALNWMLYRLSIFGVGGSRDMAADVAAQSISIDTCGWGITDGGRQ